MPDSVSVLIRAPVTAQVACCSRSACTVLNSLSECTGMHGRGRANTACTPAICCLADFNLDGARTLQDLFDFIGAYFSGSYSADVDGAAVNTVTIDDVYAYLAAYFGGC